jgi:hypothetical protein
MSVKNIILYNNILKGNFKYVKGLLENDTNLSINLMDYERKSILMIDKQGCLSY